MEIEDEIVISFLKSCDFPTPFFPPFFNASWFLLASNRNTLLPFASWWMVMGWDVICDAWGGVLGVLCLFAPGCLMENVMDGGVGLLITCLKFCFQAVSS